MAITSSEVTDLVIGTYYVRYKETATHNANGSLTVEISNPSVEPTDPVLEEVKGVKVNGW
ncbi:hypothetical protein [Paenibacillus antarcticus]|uniref:Uncharacterized protein n=1 Tax=Paenibacillus antarcticus TaxID=253703 RepID=A0A168LFM0_9BACL|nr:hypothetical protein [Paenibacillus antarcticus]OAB43325.1 hypothetical protein PBAT_18645 [Paenibacillus antarcticus]